MLFRDRREAGKKLGAALGKFAQTDAVVLALPRGGVPVGFEVAQALHAPLDVFVVRKLGVPGQEELAMGAIASGGVRVLNRTIIEGLAISPEQIDAVAAREERELERREHAYRGARGPLEVQGRTAILVDDGVATGSSMRAAVTALRQKGPREIVVAVPVASRYICDELQEESDETLCLYTPLDFFAVGQWYKEFTQISDDEVRALLEQAAKDLQQRAA
jgi:predicted phosphoribosyltransferase